MRALLRRAHADERGFTVVELLVVTAILSVVMAVAANSVITSLQIQRRQMAQMEALNGAKVALERMTRDVRAANPVEVAQPDAIEVTVERGGGTQPSTFMVQAVAGGGQRLVWCQTTLAGCTGSDVRPLLEGVSSDPGYALLRYFDDAGVELLPPIAAADMEDVQTVRLALRIDIPEHDGPLLLDNDISLRNWRP